MYVCIMYTQCSKDILCVPSVQLAGIVVVVVIVIHSRCSAVVEVTCATT